MSAEPAGRFATRPEPAREAEPADRAEAQAPIVPVPTDVRSAALTILVVLAVIFVLQYAQAVVIPVVLGVLLSYALEPIVAFIMRGRVPRPLAAAMVLLTLMGAGGVLLYQLSAQAQAIVQQLPDGARRLRQTIERTGRTAAIDQVQKAADELERAANSAGGRPAGGNRGVTRVQVEQPPIDVGQYVMYGSLGVVAGLGQAILILFLTYFLLASGDLYRRKLVKIVGPSLTQKKVTVQILQEIDRQIENFLLVQMFTSFVVGVASWLAFRTVGLNQAAFWGLMCGLFNSIPYLGPIITSGGIAVVSFLQFGTLEMTLVVSALALAITSLEGFLLTPWLTSRAARMNAVAIFVGLLFWGWVWNVWGMLLAVPMLMVIKAVCDHVEDFKGVGELLGD
ncbi:MAG TPA: AI-2E family transporter, partial [Vicinamibacterales bacterium]